jgi:hypothetical protein
LRAGKKKKTMMDTNLCLSPIDFIEGGCDSDCECLPENKKHYSDLANLRKARSEHNVQGLLLDVLRHAKVGHHLRFPCNTFDMMSYIRDGYVLTGSTDVVFIRTKKRHGVLRSKNEVIYIHHDGTLTFAENPCVCEYEFEQVRDSDGSKTVDIGSATSVKILLQDVVFEDWVHDGHGFVLQEDDLMKYISKRDECDDLESEDQVTSTHEQKL